MNPANLLKIAYATNILILVPVCWSMLWGRGVQSVFDGLVDDSTGLRLLIASLWTAILLASIGGFFAPRFFALVLVIQIFYKLMWLGLFIAPLLLNGAKIPSGIALCFAGIVATYPFLFWFGYMRAMP